MRTNDRNYYCPACEADVPVCDEDADLVVFCPECHAAYTVSVDAEFDSGKWRDLTALVPWKSKA